MGKLAGVHQGLAEERAWLNQDADQSFLGSALDKAPEEVVPWNLPGGKPPALQPLAISSRDERGVERDEGAGAVLIREEGKVGASVEATGTIKHEAQRAGLALGQARRESWVVGENGACTDRDSREEAPKVHDIQPGGLARDPSLTR
jgi:hypothetical protein